MNEIEKILHKLREKIAIEPSAFDTQQNNLCLSQALSDIRKVLTEKLEKLDLKWDIENLSSRLHRIYEEELVKQKKTSKYARIYADLPEDIKDLDRALARYINNFILTQARLDCQEAIEGVFR